MSLLTPMKHGGKQCTRLCPTPCLHADCVMCAVTKAGTSIPSANLTPRESATIARRSIPPSEDDEVPVQRRTLEGLAARAGMTLTWKDGLPYLAEDPGIGIVSGSERTMERRLRALEVENTKLNEKVRRANFNQASTKVIDNPDRIQVLEEQVEHLKKIKAEEAEADARKELRKTGATDDDIEAVKRLLGSVAPKEKFSSPLITTVGT